MSHTPHSRLAAVIRSVVRPALRIVWPVTRTGLENIPATGPVILAPNHVSFFDSVVLFGVVPRPLTFLGKAEYLDSWKTRVLFPALGMLPLDRSGGRSSMAALDAATSVLDRGGVLAIYPEGTRARDEFVHKGHTGVARLAMRTAATVIPVGIRGTDGIQPPGRRVPRPFRRCHVHFGTPLDLTEYLEQAGDGRVYRRLTDALMRDISRLSERDYLDRYAGVPVDVSAAELVAVG